MNLLIALVFVVIVSSSGEQLPSSGELLDRYERGDFAALIIPQTANDLGRLRQALERDAESWVRRGDARLQRRRQLVVATIALELAHVSLKLDWGEGRRLIEWAGTLLAKGPPDEPERLWHLATLSLFHASNDNELLVKQQKLAWSRYKNEPRFVLGLIISLENDTWPDPDRAAEWSDNDTALEEAFRMNQARRQQKVGSPQDVREKAYEYQRRLRMRTAITLLEDLSNEEETRAEVLLRLGFLHLRLRHNEIAQEQFEEVIGFADEPFVLYLANLLSGTVREQAGDRANAIAAYRAALDVVPRAQSASFALASLLFLGEARDEAATLIAEATKHPAAPDPWRSYQAGDYRFWDERLKALRGALR